MVRERVRAALGTQQQSGTETFEILEPFLTSAHRDGLARAQQAWRSERYAELSTSLSRLFGSQVIIHPPGERPAKDVLPDLVGAELTGVAKFSRQVARADEAEELDVVMHRLRLATKRARYITTALRQIDVRPVGKLERDLKRLHSLLGERHDSTITRRFLARLLETDQLDVPHALIERHIDREIALTSALDQKVPTAARKVTRWKASLSP